MLSWPAKCKKEHSNLALEIRISFSFPQGQAPTVQMESHRRCVAACIVNGIYIMESDEPSLAPAWWESFGFRLLGAPLTFKCECVLCLTKTKLFAHRPCPIYGAILEHSPPPGSRRHPSAPRYVVAFRGTLPRHPGDMHLNLRILANKQHACGRFRDARDKVAMFLDSIAAAAAAPNGRSGAVWLAGHSLGASIALDVGRTMMARKNKQGWNLPAFLFNPPQVSLAPSMLPHTLRRVAKGVIYPTSYAAKAALGTTVLRTHERDMDTLFDTLAPWVPELYVHERDVICQGFIDYFEQRHKMLNRWLRPVAEVAMKLSLRDMIISLSTSGTETGEDQRVRPHLLPSARLWKNSSYHDAHGLEQWWRPDSELRDSNEHRRCIAACMVRGTYVMESDRAKRTHGTSRALAPAWWQSFGFRLRDVREDVLDCECDCLFCRNRFKFGSQHWSIYGAILERVPTAQDWRHPPSPAAPRFIVAFRGTMRPWHRGDTFLNLELLVNRQHACRRFCHARRKVGELVASVAYYYGGGGGGAVWLAGHSLGASVALDVGRDMATKGCYLPTFLFNPPQVSMAPLLNMLRVPEVAKRFMYRVGCKVKAKLGARTTKMVTLERKMEEQFEQMAPWVPELYVHERDLICRGFIDYFEQRQNMLEYYGSSQVALLGTRLSLRDMLLFLHAEDKEEKPAVQPHLLPSARLWKTSIQGHKHGLNQWMEPDWMLNLNYRLYSYPAGA
ncbi:hypothetical protein HU200_034366 [Digitaria exilis]|uniref:Triacylglycerol lipase n=1 Tax=Digitaria exilis TaxID=1010633 RepID=A0A835BK46_9POAL|nr:hypothetical protein HU200_034366 [Digitaria exilis]